MHSTEKSSQQVGRTLRLEIEPKLSDSTGIILFNGKGFLERGDGSNEREHMVKRNAQHPPKLVHNHILNSNEKKLRFKANANGACVWRWEISAVPLGRPLFQRCHLQRCHYAVAWSRCSIIVNNHDYAAMLERAKHGLNRNFRLFYVCEGCVDLLVMANLELGYM